MYRERKTWSSRKFGESNFFFGEDDVFQMKEFRTTLMYVCIKHKKAIDGVVWNDRAVGHD